MKDTSATMRSTGAPSRSSRVRSRRAMKGQAQDCRTARRAAGSLPSRSWMWRTPGTRASDSAAVTTRIVTLARDRPRRHGVATVNSSARAIDSAVTASATRIAPTTSAGQNQPGTATYCAHTTPLGTMATTMSRMFCSATAASFARTMVRGRSGRLSSRVSSRPPSADRLTPKVPAESAPNAASAEMITRTRSAAPTRSSATARPAE
ncbi:hypothetical protein SDC9_80819 [bioreactor metagenome]|uniref:Uncharacterized protein n=1 Tax=bioreactor metagenome TaxID=1076179 RepID=A0A644Z0T2_9ZZZZ